MSERGPSLAPASPSFTGLPSDRRRRRRRGDHFLGCFCALHTWRLSISTTIGGATFWTSLPPLSVSFDSPFPPLTAPAPFPFLPFGRTLQRRTDGRNAVGERKWQQQHGAGRNGGRRGGGSSPSAAPQRRRLHIAAACTKGPLAATGRGNNVFRHQNRWAAAGYDATRAEATRGGGAALCRSVDRGRGRQGNERRPRRTRGSGYEARRHRRAWSPPGGRQAMKAKTSLKSGSSRYSRPRRLGPPTLLLLCLFGQMRNC